MNLDQDVIKSSVIALSVALGFSVMMSECKEMNESDNKRFVQCVEATKKPYACRGTTVNKTVGMDDSEEKK